MLLQGMVVLLQEILSKDTPVQVPPLIALLSVEILKGIQVKNVMTETALQMMAVRTASKTMDLYVLEQNLMFVHLFAETGWSHLTKNVTMETT